MARYKMVGKTEHKKEEKGENSHSHHIKMAQHHLKEAAKVHRKKK